MADKLKRKSSSWFVDMVPMVALLFMLLSFRSAVADWNQVPTGSMKPTILEGDRIWVNKLAYDLKVPFTRMRLARWSAPNRGDIVVFFSPRDETRLVKRIVAGPGDVLELRSNRLFINNQSAAYQALDVQALHVALEDTGPFSELNLEVWSQHHPHPVMFQGQRSPYQNFSKVRVPEDHYFAMGDNRDNSLDSRVFGFVHRDLIVGEATNVLLSWKPGAPWDLRWSRSGTSLP